MRVELAIQDSTGALVAQNAGVTRVELCAALTLGGITPSQGLVRAVRTLVPELEVHVLIRPRPGDYCYYDAAAMQMLREIDAVLEEGVNGVVIGALTPAGGIDYPLVQRLISQAGGAEVTFHRAFDHLADGEVSDAVSNLAGLGVARILTSGGASSARDGLERLAAMHESADGRLQVMAGGGVGLEDFDAFHAIGLADVHLSAKTAHARGAEPQTEVARTDEASYFLTDPQLAAAAVELGKSFDYR